jgi:hypothetical protein
MKKAIIIGAGPAIRSEEMECTGITTVTTAC